jgi:hypothetical protein
MAECNRRPKRRWSATLLLIAALMLVAGQTFLAPRLTGPTFVVYWTICFGFTGAAALAAILEVIFISRGWVQQQRSFIKDTLNEVKQLNHDKPKSPRTNDQH